MEDEPPSRTASPTALMGTLARAVHLFHRRHLLLYYASELRSAKNQRLLGVGWCANWRIEADRAVRWCWGCRFGVLLKFWLYVLDYVNQPVAGRAISATAFIAVI